MSSHKKAILVVSFGTTYGDTRAKTIDVLESEIAKSFPDWDVRRAFTSKMIIKKLAQRDNIAVDHITDAMERLLTDGYESVIIQPTHIMNGIEYDDVVRAVSKHEGSFKFLNVGKPLLTSEEDYDAVVEALYGTIAKEAYSASGNDSAIILMGHGTEHYANAAYSELYLKLVLAGHRNIYLTTVEGFPSFEDTLELMKDNKEKRVTLFPFMLVAGDHANNDMIGDEEDTLRSVFQKQGYDVRYILKGLGEYKEFRDQFIKHITDAMSDV